MNTATSYVVAKSGDAAFVIPIEIFAYGPEETEAEQQAKVVRILEARGYTCSVALPLALASLLD